MSQEKKLKVHIEFGEVKADFEGDSDQVFVSAVRFMTEVNPNLTILKKITYTPNLAGIAEKLAGFIEITPEGPILSSAIDMPAKNAVCIALLGARVGKQIGRIAAETLSSLDLARIVGKSRKTIANEVPKLIDEGLIQRTGEGEYRLTILGIRRAEVLLDEYEKGRP